MKRTLTLIALVMAGLNLSFAQLMSSHAPATPASAISPDSLTKPVARVNGTVLTQRDLLREEYTIFPYARQHNGSIPKEMEPGIRGGAMQMIVFEELVYQEALRRKLIVPPAKLQKAETEFRGQFRTDQQFQQVLQQEFHGSRKELRDEIRRSLLIDSLLKTEVEAKSAVSLVELKSFYDKNPNRFQYPESFAIQTISFMPPQNATPEQVKEARKRAEAALPQAKAAKTYEAYGLLAEKISEDDYRVMMGDHKTVDRAKMAPQLVTALLAMQPGQVSDIIQVEQIYTIVRLSKHVPAGKTKFEDVKDQLKQELQKKKTNEIRAAYGKKLRQGAKIEIL